jgi:hypothetical protein
MSEPGKENEEIAQVRLLLSAHGGLEPLAGESASGAALGVVQR